MNSQYKNHNNKNVFKRNLGAVSKIKKWNNHPTGSPQRDSKQEPMKSSNKEYEDYWKQKRFIEEEEILKPTPTHLSKLTRLMSSREMRLYRSIGTISTKKDIYTEMRTYFNGTSQKAAFSCLLYNCYFDGLNVTTGMATHQLQINRSSALAMIKHCIKKEWLTEFKRYKYKVEPIVCDAWHYYMENLVSQNTELFRKINVLAEAYLLDKDDGLPID